MGDNRLIANAPLEEGILAWDRAITALLREIELIGQGRPVDASVMTQLLVAVELARRRCERSANEFSTQLPPRP